MVAALRFGGDPQQPRRLTRAGDGERGAFGPGGFGEFVANGHGNGLDAEGEAAAVPVPDGLVQVVGVECAGAGAPSDVHRGEQIWVAGIREQPSDRLPTEVAHRDPQVEQGRAGGDVQGPAVWILVGKSPPDVGVDLHSGRFGVEAEAPGLRVVHRGRGDSRSDQLLQHRRVQIRAGHEGLLPGEASCGACDVLSLLPQAERGEGAVRPQPEAVWVPASGSGAG